MGRSLTMLGSLALAAAIWIATGTLEPRQVGSTADARSPARLREDGNVGPVPPIAVLPPPRLGGHHHPLEPALEDRRESIIECRS